MKMYPMILSSMSIFIAQRQDPKKLESEMMNEKGYWQSFKQLQTCGPISTFRTDWLYNSAN